MRVYDVLRLRLHAFETATWITMFGEVMHLTVPTLHLTTKASIVTFSLAACV